MGKDSKIEWTDHTFSPWWGCTRVSPGCEHCYAEAFDKRTGGAHWGRSSERRFFGEKHWAEPLKWNAAAASDGVRRRVFCASMADVFEDRPELYAPRSRLFALIRDTPALDWLLLTKRPENASLLWDRAQYDAFNGADSFGLVWGPNVWLGVTAEDQRRWDERVPVLMSTPAVVRFVSVEPMLGPLDLRGPSPFPEWIIFGGESGAGARPCAVEWIEAAMAQAANRGASVFVKQLGRFVVSTQRIDHETGAWVWRAHLRDAKGGDWEEWPPELCVREFPRVETRSR